MRIVCTGFHTTYQYELAQLGAEYQFDYVRSVWNDWIRPKPANVRLVEEPDPLRCYDVVLAYRVPDLVEWRQRLASEGAAIPVVVSLHTYPPHWEEYVAEVGMPAHRLPEILRGYPKVFVSPAARLLWGFADDPESRVIHHAVDGGLWHGYLGDDPVILTVCNQMWEQDRYRGGSLFDLVTYGLSRWVIGENPGRSVRAPSLDAVREAYRSARVFLWTGQRGPPSFAPLEAMATGMPLVAAHTPDWAEIIEDGVNGFVCHDPLALRERCRRLLANQDLARVIGSRGRETVLARFAPTQFQQAWQQVLETAKGAAACGGG